MDSNYVQSGNIAAPSRAKYQHNNLKTLISVYDQTSVFLANNESSNEARNKN
jgi:hypothetical protein